MFRSRKLFGSEPVSSLVLTTARCRKVNARRRVFLQILMGAAFTAFGSTVLNAQTFNINSGAGSWNTNASWTPAAFPNGIGASATFNDATAASTVSLNGAMTVGSLNFTQNSSVLRTLQNGTGGSLIFDAVGTGVATITVNGTSITTNNVTISASTTLNDTLLFTNNNVSGTGAATATMTGIVTGSGGFTKAGAGRFSFSTVAKTYTGATTVNEGRLRFTATGTATGTSSITVNSGGSLYLDSSSGTFGFGTAGITINGDGVNETGGQGALRNQGSGTNTLNNLVTLGSNATIHVDGSSTLVLASGLAGSSATTLTKTGGGTLSLTSANASLDSSAIVTNGTITTSAASRIGSGSLSFAQSTASNTAVTLNNASQSIAGLSTTWADATGTQTQTLTLNGTALTINQATNTTFGNGAVPTLTGSIAGTGSIIKTGFGTLTFTGANTYTGGTTISGGTLALGHATNTLANGGAINVSGGTLSIGANSDTVGAVTLTSGSITGTSGVLTGTGSNYNVQSGSVSAILGGTVGLDKSTAGTVTLSGANTYTGATNVTAGTLIVNGNNSAATGAVTVSSGATLAGTGTIGGSTTIAGIHNPGNSPGIQTFGSDLTYSGGSSVNWELIGNTTTNTPNPSATFDSIVVGGNLNFAGSTLLNLNFASAGSNVLWGDSFWNTSKTGTNGWLVYDVTGSTTNFGGFQLNAFNWTDKNGVALNTARSGASFGLTQQGNDIYLNYTISAVPEPSSVILLTSSVVVFAYLKRRRKRNNPQA